MQMAFVYIFDSKINDFIKQKFHDIRRSVMNFTENSGGYESMVWVNDRHGREYSCYINDLKETESFDELPEELQKKCLDVNTLIGTERW